MSNIMYCMLVISLLSSFICNCAEDSQPDSYDPNKFLIKPWEIVAYREGWQYRQRLILSLSGGFEGELVRVKGPNYDEYRVSRLIDRASNSWYYNTDPVEFLKLKSVCLGTKVKTTALKRADAEAQRKADLDKKERDLSFKETALILEAKRLNEKEKKLEVRMAKLKLKECRIKSNQQSEKVHRRGWSSRGKQVQGSHN